MTPVVWNVFPACICPTARQNLLLDQEFRGILEGSCLSVFQLLPLPLLLSLVVGKGRQSSASWDRSRPCVSPFRSRSPEPLCPVSVPLGKVMAWLSSQGLINLQLTPGAEQEMQEGWGHPKGCCCSGYSFLGCGGCMCVYIHVYMYPYTYLCVYPYPYPCVCIHTHIPVCISFVLAYNDSLGFFFWSNWRNRDRPFLTRKALVTMEIIKFSCVQGNDIQHHPCACLTGNSAERIKDPVIGYCDNANSTLCLEEYIVPCSSILIFLILIFSSL